MGEPRPRGSNARAAWMNRHRVLCRAWQPEGVRHFLRLIRSRGRRCCAVPEAAAELELSVRHLHRLIMDSLGCPPGTVIDLVRIVNVAREIARGRRPLKAIAKTHGFYDQAAMNRQFLRFTGVPPGEYRAKTGRGRKVHPA